jgi:dihydroxy-acid dehydratase
VQEGDTISIDVAQGRLQLEISEAELKRRMANWVAPALRYKTGVFAKYALSVSSASLGAVTTPNRSNPDEEAEGKRSSEFSSAGAKGR